MDKFMLGSENRKQSLIFGVRRGHLKSVRKLVHFYDFSSSQAWLEGYALLVDAIKKKHRRIAKILIKNGVKVNNHCQNDSNTPLHLAVMNGDTGIVKMLLDRGADVHVKNTCGLTPLHSGVVNGNIKIVKMLLDRCADVHVSSTCGHTPLRCAIEKDSEEIGMLLLKSTVNVNIKAMDITTLLLNAAEKGHPRIAEVFLNHGVDIHSASTSTWKEGYMPIHFASQQGSEEAVRLFLSKGADVNAKTKDDLTPLHLAIEAEHETVIKLLLKHRANVDAQDKSGKTILHHAVKKGNSTIVEDILKYCPDINNQSNRSTLKTAVCGYGGSYNEIIANLLQYGFIVNPEDVNNPEMLHNAVAIESLKMVRHLLKNGADVNGVDSSIFRCGATPLHTAVNSRKERAVNLLINCGANVNVKNKTGKTPLFYAVEQGDVRMIKLFLTNGANVKDSPELLHAAAAKGRLEIIENLLKYGAEFDFRDRFGRTALYVAIRDVHIEIVNALLEYGSDINITSKKNHTPLEYAVLCTSIMYNTTYCTDEYDYDFYDSDDSDCSIYLYEEHKFYGDDFFDGIRILASRGEILELLKKHIVRLEAVGLYVSEKNVQCVTTDYRMIFFRDECEDEIEIMKSQKIGNSYASFYDILTKNSHQLAIYAKNENIVQAFKSVAYDTEFPIYFGMIEAKFRRGVERKELMELGYQFFYSLFESLPELPLLCIENIFSYLSNNDIKLLHTCV